MVSKVFLPSIEGDIVKDHIKPTSDVHQVSFGNNIFIDVEEDIGLVLFEVNIGIEAIKVVFNINLEVDP